MSKYNTVKDRKTISLINKIRKIVTKYGLTDVEWAQAISSQYFLLCLSKELKWDSKDHECLVNKCLSSFSVTYIGNYILDNEKILITPDETKRIIACMNEEDVSDDYYTHSAKMRAKNIDSEKMYYNYHYGLLIKILSSENTNGLKALKHQCLDCLLTDQAIDSSGGWYPYRVPWITAWILISLYGIDLSTYENHEKINEVIHGAIDSLY